MPNANHNVEYLQDSVSTDISPPGMARQMQMTAHMPNNCHSFPQPSMLGLLGLFFVPFLLPRPPAPLAASPAAPPTALVEFHARCR